MPAGKAWKGDPGRVSGHGPGEGSAGCFIAGAGCFVFSDFRRGRQSTNRGEDPSSSGRASGLAVPCPLSTAGYRSYVVSEMTQESRPPCLDERGAPRDGQPQTTKRRLFVQLLVADSTADLSPAECWRNLAAALTRRGAAAVIYEDLNHPQGLGLVTWTEDPSHFVTRVRPAFGDIGTRLRIRPGFSMLGRTYSTGFEPDLEHWLLTRPQETLLNPAWPWAIWYPLRRGGAFEALAPMEKSQVLREHGAIGRAYGEADLAHDIRLACHGLDANDNEFVIGLVGAELHPLSHVVQAMRSTRQTREFISHMGPFFVGRAVWRHPGPGSATDAESSHS